MTPESFGILAAALILGAMGYAISRYVGQPALDLVYRTRPENERPVAQFTEMPQTKAPVETVTSRNEAEADISAPPLCNADSGCNQIDPKGADESFADAGAPVNLVKSDIAGLSGPPVEDRDNPPTVTSTAEAALTVPTTATFGLESDAKAAVAARSPSRSPPKKAKSKSKPAKRLPKSEPARV